MLQEELANQIGRAITISRPIRNRGAAEIAISFAYKIGVGDPHLTLVEQEPIIELAAIAALDGGHSTLDELVLEKRRVMRRRKIVILLSEELMGRLGAMTIDEM